MFTDIRRRLDCGGKCRFWRKRATQFHVRASSITGGEIEIRLDSSQGKIVCVLGVGSCGSYDNWDIFSSELSRVTGVHNVFFIFKGDSEHNLLLRLLVV